MNDSPDRPVLMPRDSELPPPRPGVRHVLVPLLPFIIISDDDLRAMIDRRFHWPMLILALLMLPLLVVEFWIDPEEGKPMWWVCVIALSLIWLAFFVEFVVKIAIAECRIEYVRHNWLDIIIIVLPVLRPFRAGTGILRTSRLFTIRGVGLKFARYAFTAVVGLEATERLLQRLGFKEARARKTPEKMTRRQLIDEVKCRRRRDDAWEQWHSEHLVHLLERGVSLYESPGPELEEVEEEIESVETTETASQPDEDPTIGPSCESPSPN